MKQGVIVEQRGSVLEITINRPPVNAIDLPTSVALGEAFAKSRDDADLITCAVTGAGDALDKHPEAPVTPRQMAQSERG